MDKDEKKELAEEEVLVDSEEKQPISSLDEETITEDSTETNEVNNQEKVYEENIDEKIEMEKSNNDIDEDKEPTKEFDIVTGTTTVKENNNDNKNMDKKKLFLIIGYVTLLLIVVLLIILLIINKDNDDKPVPEKPKEPEITVPSDEECQTLIKEYGNKLALFVRDKIASGHDASLIKKEEVINLLDGYEVKCETFEIEDNGNIKLDKCSINGSEAVYSYEKTYSAKPDTEYQLASKDGKLVFYYDGWFLSDEKLTDYKKYTIKCEEESCVLDKAYDYYAIIKEQSGKVIVYDFYNNKKVYTALPGYDVNIIGKYDKDYNEEAYVLTIRNPEKEEALYSLKQNKIVVEYGLYTYDWEIKGFCIDSCSNVIVENYINIYSGKKKGLINATDFSVVMEPTDYSDITTYGEYIHVKKGDYEGLLRYTDGKLITLVKPNKYQSVVYNENHILIKKSGKYGALDITGEKQYLNGKFYDAVVIANYPNGGALVLDGNTLKVLDLEGNLLNNLGKLPTGTKLYDDYVFSSGSYEDDETGVNAWLKFTNPDYDESINDAYWECTEACEDLDGEAYETCLEQCEPLYNDEKSHDCIEYNYNFYNETLEKYLLECEGDYAKPVLYLYPTLPTFITVTFSNPENLTTTYPKYETGWKVLASPNGDLYDSKNNYYYALYWEEDNNHRVDFNEGFYVTKHNAIEFLEDKLTKIGLNDKERNEFIMYWLPILEKNGKSLVYFELTEERDLYSKINIKPKPDSLLRVAIHIKKVDSYTKIKEQHLPTFKRKGFTAIEWGGVLY